MSIPAARFILASFVCGTDLEVLHMTVLGLAAFGPILVFEIRKRTF